MDAAATGDTNRRLEQARSAIVERWKELALAIYRQRGASFLGSEPDRFRNPVGHLTGESLAALFDGLLEDAPPQRMRRALDGIVRIRAVQDVAPSAALGFVFLLKRVIREQLGAIGDGRDGGGVAVFDRRIDRLALQAFDVFTACREQICDLRVREIRRRTSTLLERLEQRDSERPVAFEARGGSPE